MLPSVLKSAATATNRTAREAVGAEDNAPISRASELPGNSVADTKAEMHNDQTPPLPARKSAIASNIVCQASKTEKAGTQSNPAELTEHSR